MLNPDNPIIQAIREIKSICLLLKTNPHIADSYCISFDGEQQNRLSTKELLKVLNDHFEIDISSEELQSLLPEICHAYGLTYEPSDGIFPIAFINLC